MGFRLFCDNDACAAEIESGPGQPALYAKGRLYCTDCQAYVAQVDAEIRKRGVEIAMKGQEELDALRRELMARMMPVERGGSGEGFSQWPVVG